MKASFQDYLPKIWHWLKNAWTNFMLGVGNLVVGLIVIMVLVSVSGKSGGLIEPSIQQKLVTRGGVDQIAVIDLTGPIMSGDAAGEGAFASTGVMSDRVIQVLDTVKEDDKVKAVVLKINSPGGGVVASDEIYRKVLELRATKPVVASMGDVAASGGYYIAAGSHKIVANPATITGSIGVIAQFPKLVGLYDKIGLEMRTFTTGEFKDIGSADRDFRPEEKVIIDTMLDEAYDQFVAAIATGRSMEEAKVRTLGDGRIYTGIQAKNNGLVDELGGFDRAVELAAEMAKVEDPTVVKYLNQSFWETVLESKIVPGPFQALDRVIPSGEYGLFYRWQ